jgi:hypothetical protein
MPVSQEHNRQGNHALDQVPPTHRADAREQEREAGQQERHPLVGVRSMRAASEWHPPPSSFFSGKAPSRPLLALIAWVAAALFGLWGGYQIFRLFFGW